MAGSGARSNGPAKPPRAGTRACKLRPARGGREPPCARKNGQNNGQLRGRPTQAGTGRRRPVGQGRRHEWRTRQRLPREEASGAEMKALGGLQLRLQHRLLLEPSQMGFSGMAPTLEQLGAPRIPLTGADMARWSHEIVAPSDSRGSSMPFCQPCPRMGLAGARFAGRWPADDVSGARGPWGGRGRRRPWGGGAATVASRAWWRWWPALRPLGT